MRYWIEWECVYENFKYSEEVSEEELQRRLNDSGIKVTGVWAIQEPAE